MGNYFLKIWFAILVCFSHTKLSILGFIPPSQTLSVKCIEKERKALLDFKQGLQDYSSMLSTWSDDDNNKDCCKWKGIECNNETGHVKGLLLGASNIHYLIGDDFSISPFLELQNMEYLDLSGHSFPDCQIPEQLGSFKNLRYLNLSYTIFVGGIPYQLGNLSNLECLDLQWSFLEGAIPSELGNLSKLEYLDLNHNDLYGAIPSQLGKLTSLQYLDLRYNLVDGEIPYQLGNLSQLRYLDLGESSLSGAVPFQVGNLPFLHTLKLGSNIDINFNDAKWLTSLMSLTTLHLNFYYRLSDNNISSLFASHSNLSASLSILDLSGNKLTSSTFQLLANCSLNLQELYLSNNDIVLSSPHYLNLPSLVILDLSYNNLTSSIFQENFNFSSKLQKLQLANCSLTDRSFLVTSTSMKKSSSSLLSLDLSSNLLKSSTIFHWISNFTTNLHSLSLDMNLLEGPIPCGLGKVMNSLELLSIASNKLQGEIPTSLGNICTLQGLSLNNNNLSGEISSFIQNSSWCNGHVFQTLDLSYNKITGMLPNISILTSLRTLDLSNNQLTGDITEYHLINLTELLTLDLSGNYLFLKFGIAWIPPFQLTVLGLASCKMGPNFPSWIETQSQLSFLDIYNAGIDDFVPEWLWNKLQAIQKMNMSCNTLRGTIPNLPIKVSSWFVIILNSNHFEGGIPTFMSQAFTLDLSKNKISDISSFLCKRNTKAPLYTLDLSNNQIGGLLPDCWQYLDSLAFLDLSNNKLRGKIPFSMATLVQLDVLVLRNNSFIGELPFTWKNYSDLYILDVSENRLSGLIPPWIGESLNNLEILSLRENLFFGSVPVHLCYLKKIQLLDLSRNNLSGGIPTCLTNLTAMMKSELDTSGREVFQKMTHKRTMMILYESNVFFMWKGQDYEFLNPEHLLKSIDLSSNNLTGKIPREVGYLHGLVSLNLSRNNLHGEIPSEIGNLASLEFIDLSRNHLSGKIPTSLSKIDRLAKLDLSNNCLVGRIPWGRQLQTLDVTGFEGNPGLCGEKLNKSCPGEETKVEVQGTPIHGEDDNSIFYEALYMSLGFGFFIGFWGLLGSILLWQPWRNSYLSFLNRLTLSIL